jgi:hypothetical protein
VDAVIAWLHPRIVIPMHYRIPELETSAESPSDLGEIDPWLEGRPNVERAEDNRLVLSLDRLPDTQTILVLRHSPAVSRGESR